MANNALKKITTRAKQLQKKHPNTKWTSLIKKAGADYRAGKIKPSKKKVSGLRLPIKKRLKPVQVTHVNMVAKAGLTPAAAKHFLKKDIEEKMSKQLFIKETGRTKTERKQAAKKAAAYKRQLSDLNKEY